MPSIMAVVAMVAPEAMEAMEVTPEDMEDMEDTEARGPLRLNLRLLLLLPPRPRLPLRLTTDMEDMVWDTEVPMV